MAEDVAVAVRRHVPVEQRPAGQALAVAPAQPLGARPQRLVAVVLVLAEVLAEHADGVEGAEDAEQRARQHVPPVVAVVGDAGQRAGERPEQEEALQPRHQQQGHVAQHASPQEDHDEERGVDGDGGVAGGEGAHRVAHVVGRLPLVGALEVVDPGPDVARGQGAVGVGPARVQEVRPRLRDQQLHGVRHEHDDAEAQHVLAVPAAGGARPGPQAAQDAAGAAAAPAPRERHGGLDEPQRDPRQGEAPGQQHAGGHRVPPELEVDLGVVAVEARPGRGHDAELDGRQQRQH